MELISLVGSSSKRRSSLITKQDRWSSSAEKDNDLEENSELKTHLPQRQRLNKGPTTLFQKRMLVTEVATEEMYTTGCDKRSHCKVFVCMAVEKAERKPLLEDGNLERQNKNQNWMLECKNNVREQGTSAREEEYTAEKKNIQRRRSAASYTTTELARVDGHGLAGTELAEGRRCQRRRIYTHI